MKRIGRILLYFALCALAVSCANYEYDGPEAFNDKMEGLFIHYDSQAPYATAIVTVKKGSDGNSYLWLSEEHKLIPREQIPFTGQYRAMAGISESGIPDNNGFRRVTMDWLEPLDEGEVRTGARTTAWIFFSIPGSLGSKTPILLSITIPGGGSIPSTTIFTSCPEKTHILLS